MPEQAFRHPGGQSRSQDQRRRFPHDPSHPQDDGGEDAGHGAGQHHPHYNPQPARPQSQRPFLVAFRDGQEGFFRGAHDGGQDAERHGQAARQDRSAEPQHMAEHGVAEQAEQHRRHAREHLGGEADNPHQPPLLRILGQIDRAGQADGGDDQQGEHHDVQGTDQHGQDPPPRLIPGGIGAGQELPGDVGQAVYQNIPDQPDEHRHSQCGAEDDQTAEKGVLRAPAFPVQGQGPRRGEGRPLIPCHRSSPPSWTAR